MPSLVLTPVLLWPCQQGRSPPEGTAGPILAGGAAGAPCSSHPPSLMGLGGRRARGDVFHINQASRNRTRKCREEEPHLPSCTLGATRAGPAPVEGCRPGSSQEVAGMGARATQHFGAFSTKARPPRDAEQLKLCYRCMIHFFFPSEFLPITKSYLNRLQESCHLLLTLLNTDSAALGFSPPSVLPFCPVSFFWWLLKGQNGIVHQ